MIFEIEINREFSASHAVRVNNKREPSHNHDWQFKAILEGRALNDEDMVIEFSLLKAIIDSILIEYTGKDLNLLFKDRNPTVEVLAIDLFERVDLTIRERVSNVRLKAVALAEEPSLWFWVKRP